jgi:small-conductance mechanosensitive channel
MRLLRYALIGLWLAAMSIAGAMAQQQPQAQPQPPSAGAPAPAAAPAAPAMRPKPALPAEITDPIRKLQEDVTRAEKSVQQIKEIESELQRLRAEVETIIYDSTARAETLRPQLTEVRDQIQKLGPPPAAGQPPESETVKGERERLNALAAELDAAIKTSELAWVRAKQVIDRITAYRYQQFTRNLFERRQSPLLPALWRDVGERLDSVLGRVRYYGGDWLFWAGRHSGELGLLALALVGLMGGSWLLRQVYLVPHMRRPEPPPPTFFERIVRASWLAPMRMLAPLLAVVGSYVAFDSMDLMFAPWDGVGNALLKSLILYFAAASLASVVLAPRHPWWRLVPVDNQTAARLSFFIKAFVAVYGIDAVLAEFSRVVYAPLTMTIAQSFITSLLFAGLLAALLLTPFTPQRGEDRPVNGKSEYPTEAESRHRPYWLKSPLWAIALLIVGAASSGYIALARFVAFQLVMSGVVLTTVGLVYLAIRAVTRGRADGRHVLGEFLANRFGLDGLRQIQLSRLVEFAATFALILAALPILMSQWGFSGAEIRDYSKALLFGFEVGQFKISLARILIGIAIFIALLLATRLVQRWLREGMLHQSRMDTGIANSIDTAVGYGGVALAALISISYAGFDVTSLAIVAGALSVGIGFGLQSIVNNFVSGLILLVERPIKVGDWVVVGGEQGNVRRISVRSTEIETFDRASLIVPNSELVSGRVLNWTHRNLFGRVIIKVSVEPNADPEKVIALLTNVAKHHPVVVQQPEPSAMLDSFGADKLDFSLRATLTDVNAGGRVQSDLRVAILKAFRESGLIGVIQSASAPPTPGAPVQAAPAVHAHLPPPSAPPPPAPLTEPLPVPPPAQPRAPATDRPLTARIPTLATPDRKA